MVRASCARALVSRVVDRVVGGIEQHRHFYVEKQLTAAPNLVPVFDFTPGAIAGESIRAYSGLYMEDYQEGEKSWS